MEFESDDVPVHMAVTIDCTDLERMFGFWTGLLGVEGQIHEPFGFLRPAEGRAAAIWLQRVPEPRVGKNRLHLDLIARDLAAVERRIEDLGGSLDGMHEWEGHMWRVCLDPEGNLFDVMQAPDRE